MLLRIRERKREMTSLYASKSDGHRDEGVLYCHTAFSSSLILLQSRVTSHGLLLLLLLLLWRPVLVYMTPATCNQ